MDKNVPIYKPRFDDLEKAALNPDSHALYAGKIVQLTGRYVAQGGRTFTLCRYKISCCAADAVPLNAVIELDPTCQESLDAGNLQDKWVEVTGRVSFRQRPDGTYVPALVLTPGADWPLDRLVNVLPTPPQDIYLN